MCFIAENLGSTYFSQVKKIIGQLLTGRPRTKFYNFSLCVGGRFGLKEDDLRQLMVQLEMIDTLSNIQMFITECCSTKFLSPLTSAHQDIFNIILNGNNKTFIK